MSIISRDAPIIGYNIGIGPILALIRLIGYGRHAADNCIICACVKPHVYSRTFFVHLLELKLERGSMSTGRKKSEIWSYFIVTEDAHYAECKKCKVKISRGDRNTKTFNTTNLVQHLRKHSEEFKKFEKEKADNASNQAKTPQQLSLPETEDRVKPWNINDPRAQRITRRLVEMIALDSQPFSVVEDSGFIRFLKELEPRYTVPSRKYVTETILPRVTRGVTDEVKKELQSVEWYSFTTYIWSTEVSSDCLLSLTVHWLTKDFEKKEAVLHAQSLPGSHTGEVLSHEYHNMLAKWSIKAEQVHLIIRDNASNMVKAMRDGNFEDLGCFDHTLQLVIRDGIFSQRAVIDSLAICHNIVSHFKRSPLAYSHLKTIQDNLQLPKHNLKLDNPTRWNSTYYMLEVILEQKMALAPYATEYGDIQQLTPNQLDLIGKLVKVLCYIEEITKSISCDAASVSLIIPFIRGLRLTLEKNDDSDRGVRTMKADMLKSSNDRYDGVEQEGVLAVATLLDPRFKDKFFSGAEAKTTARQLLIAQMSELSSGDVTEVPSPKRKKGNDSKILKCFSEILQESGASIVGDVGDTEVDQYLKEPLIQFHRANSYLWWKNNTHRFPQLSKLARRYLAPPPTSVASERLFSTAGDIYDEKRNCLAPERAEALLFVKKKLFIG